MPAVSAGLTAVIPAAGITPAAAPPSYSGSRSEQRRAKAATGAAGGSYNRSYEGSHGGSMDVSGTRGAAYGPEALRPAAPATYRPPVPNGESYNSQRDGGSSWSLRRRRRRQPQHDRHRPQPKRAPYYGGGRVRRRAYRLYRPMPGMERARRGGS